jgi:hypothetical protein
VRSGWPSRCATALRAKTSQQEARQREAEAREVALRAALARQPDSPNRAVERLLTEEPGGPRTNKLRELLGAVAERAPRLIGRDIVAAFTASDTGPAAHEAGMSWDTRPHRRS